MTFSGDSHAAGLPRIHPNLKDIAADYIREGIVEGRFRPGARVDQDEIARNLGISRLPVREALIELAQKRYVTVIPRRGAFVVELGIEDVKDHYEVIGMVFALAAGRASTELTESQLLELKRIDQQIAQTENPAVSEALNRGFYELINSAGSSARLSAILEFLSGTLPYNFYIASPAWKETERNYRKRMLAALESHDSEAAAGVAVEHLRECGRLTVEELHVRHYWSAQEAEPPSPPRALGETQPS